MVKRLSLIYGLIVLAIGILGFIPNALIGRDGFFLTNAAHDVVHLITGLLLLLVAYTSEETAVATFRGLSVVYVIIALVGFFQIGAVGSGFMLDLFQINGADNWLHLAFTLVFALSGFTASVSAPRRAFAARERWDDDRL